MTTLYREDASGGVRISSERKIGDVRIPNYVYDLWLPLLGATAIGVYSTYCRLERGESVKSMTLERLAYAFQIGKKTLLTINKQLADCGFIKTTAPTGDQRLMHYTTEIVILDPPQAVSAELITKYRPERYKPLCSWLVDTEVPNRTPGRPDENDGMDIPETANVASLDQLHSDPIGSVANAANAVSQSAQSNLPGIEETEGLIATSKDLEDPQPPSAARAPSPDPVDLSAEVWAATDRAMDCLFRQAKGNIQAFQAKRNALVDALNAAYDKPDEQLRLCREAMHPAAAPDHAADPPPPPAEPQQPPDGYEYRYVHGDMIKEPSTSIHWKAERHLKPRGGVHMLCRRSGQFFKTWARWQQKEAPIQDCPYCLDELEKRIAAARAQPKAPTARKAQPWDVLANEVARVLFDAKDPAGVNAVMGRVAPILHGDKKSGRCIGIIEYEHERQGDVPGGLDFAALAADVPVFYMWYRTQCDKPLKDCAKVLDYWQAWRTSNQPSETPKADDAWVWIDDPDVPGGNVKKRIHRDYLAFYQAQQGGVK